MRKSSPGPLARVAAGLLVLRFGHGATDALLGDLEEEYAVHQHPERGRARAEAWFVGQVVGAAWHLAGSEIKRRKRFGRGGRTMGGWVLDLRCTVRGLLRRPLFALGVVLTLALGIGLNVAIFSVAEAVVFEELPYQEPDRLMRVHPEALFYADLTQVEWFAERNTVFSEMAGWGRAIFTLERDGEAEEVRGGRVQWNHFAMLGVEPALGRAFREEDSSGGGSDVLVLSHALWTSSFGADSAIIGTDVSVSGTRYRVVGVLAADHQPIEEDWQAWAPINMDPGHPHAGNAMAFNARLRAGVSAAQAQEEMRSLFQRWATEHQGGSYTPDELAGITVVPLQTFLTGGSDRLLLPALLAVALVLLVACGNLSNLILAHGRARDHEMAIRRAIGAGAGRIGRLVLTEAGLLALVGGAVGLALGAGTLEAFRTALPEVLPRTRGISIDGGVVLFAVAATAAATLISWTLPLVQSGRVAAGRGVRVADTLRSGALRTSHLLVAGQIALTVVLVGSASLTLRSWAALTSEDPGFRPESVVTFRPRFPSGRFSEEEETLLHESMLERLRSAPGVQAAGTVLFMPMHSGGAWTGVRPFDLPEGPDADTEVSVRMVSEGYFEAMGIELVEGRAVTAGDREGTEPVVVLNRQAASLVWPGEAAVGRMLVTGSDEVPRRVVGVVGDVRQSGLASEAFPEIYYPVRQVPSNRRAFAVRVAGDPSSALPGIAAAVHDVDPTIALMDFAPLEQVVGDSISRPRFFTSLLSLFGLTTLALGVVGIWSVTAHAVRRARRELGIRLALGASGPELVRLMAMQGLAPIVTGTAAGLAGFLLIGRAVSGFLYRVEPADPVTLILVPLLLLCVGVAATLGPAVRAGTLDPAEVLREE